MSTQKPALLMPALIGGGLAGILSGIPLLNCLCCLWIIGGAMLASYLLAKEMRPRIMTAGEGAIVGTISGLIAAAVSTLVSIPFQGIFRGEFFQKFMDRFAEYAKEMPEGWETWLEGSFETSLPMLMLSLLISAVIFGALGALGGIIGASLFSKKNPQGAPDVPQNPGDSQS
jgi:hypothetical protein